MYPGRPRRPMPPAPRQRMRPPMPPRRGRSPSGQNIISHFRDAEGNLDINKISTTAQQVGKLYSQVGPLVGPMISKFKKN